MPHNCQHTSNKSRWVGIYCLILQWGLLAFAWAVLADSGKTTIYFFSSETNINNYASLKQEFDRYLAQQGPYEFQPFKDRSAFEKRIKDAGSGLVLLSAWHYQEIYKSHDIKPVLIGTLGGHQTQKRILVVLNGQTGPAKFMDIIASAADEQLTRLVCEKMALSMPVDFKQLKILAVPKDIDALMSVGFGISKAALTTENAFQRLKSVNPALHRKMRILALGQDTYMPIVAVISRENEHVRRLLSIVEKMPGNEDGRSRIGMLGLDGWHKVEPAEEKKLELNNCKTAPKIK